MADIVDRYLESAAAASPAVEPLREISVAEWPSLHDLFQSNWPYAVEGYCLLDMLITTPGVATSFNFRVYCPYGSIHKGMIAISETETYHMYICPVKTDNLACMEEVLLATKIINWNKDIIVPSVMPDVMRMIDRVASVLKLEVKCNGFVVKYLKTQDSLQFADAELPPDTYVGPLRVEHLSMVDATWPFRSETSYNYFQKLMDNNLTHVLYSASTHLPLAWVFVDETGTLSHLYSMERCRRLGYASYITKIAANNLLRNGQHVLAYSLMDNFAAQRFFIKLGFRNLGVTSWILLQKRVVNIPSCAYCRIVEFHPTPNLT
ncbi:uncharacterized protein LOC128677549 [Plodia interpunctella]|uniref:uncharacterized protein LOC128677549 n=1 Tax=Plodia interpunctella TaxID=58824 RepID=UPI0023687506|nr:uncharacterized protein LOC128677549 [Plodia interpunctella]